MLVSNLVWLLFGVEQAAYAAAAAAVFDCLLQRYDGGESDPKQ